MILETIHGSHLYGLNHPDSDRDVFRVVESQSRTTHVIRGEEDITQMPFDRFLENVFHGSPQSCEALFSPLATIDPMYEPFLRAIRVTGDDVFQRYRRTIKAFSYGTDKQKRHAMRLGFNLADLRKYGRFNPTLTNDQRTSVILVSQLYSGQSLYDIASNL